MDIIVKKENLTNNSPPYDKNYCDEGVQTSLININEQENDTNNNNKKDEPLSTIIFTDKSALINQEITFLSIKIPKMILLILEMILKNPYIKIIKIRIV